MVGPKIKPTLNPGDFHLVVNEESERIKCFDHEGADHWGKALPALARGVGGSYNLPSGNTPPGLYEMGTLYISKAWESYWKIWAPYGEYCYDMEERENQENSRGRAGISLHGGGSAAPDPLAPMQILLPTHGCVRMHNLHIKQFILPLTHYRWPATKFGLLLRRKNRVYISVWQR
jgi:hypothetical protein